jgi:hypothetical protein
MKARATRKRKRSRIVRYNSLDDVSVKPLKPASVSCFTLPVKKVFSSA